MISYKRHERILIIKLYILEGSIGEYSGHMSNTLGIFSSEEKREEAIQKLLAEMYDEIDRPFRTRKAAPKYYLPPYNSEEHDSYEQTELIKYELELDSLYDD